MKTSTAITIAIIAVLILAAALIFLPKGQTDINAPRGNDDEAVFCTLDAAVCSDGSYVGRSGPECSFDACPDGTIPGSANTTPDDTSIVPTEDTQVSPTPSFYDEGK